MSHRFDATLKQLFTPAPEDFAAVFGLPLVRPAVALNVDLSTISAATDVALGFGNPLQEVVDLNFQSGPDPKVAARCHLYNAALHFRFGVPVRTLLVLLRPQADSAKLSGNLAYVCGASSVEFRYELVRMWLQSNESFLQGSVQLLPLATLCQLPPDRPMLEALRDVVREIDRRLANECEHAQAVRLMTAAFVLTGLRAPLESLGPIYQGVRVMHESTAFDYYVEKGAIDGARHILLRQGRKRFGPPDEAEEKVPANEDAFPTGHVQSRRLAVFKGLLFLHRPIHARQPGDAAKILFVAGYNRRTVFQGDGANTEVHGADVQTHRAELLKPNDRRMMNGATENRLHTGNSRAANNS